MYKKQYYCYCDKCGRVNVKDTEFVNISEGEYGQDRYTFICKKCGEKSTSNVVG